MVGHDDSNFRRTNAINGNQDLENVEGTGIPRFGFESSSWLEKPAAGCHPTTRGHACFRAVPLSKNPSPAQIAAYDAY